MRSSYYAYDGVRNITLEALQAELVRTHHIKINIVEFESLTLTAGSLWASLTHEKTLHVFLALHPCTQELEPMRRSGAKSTQPGLCGREGRLEVET